MTTITCDQDNFVTSAIPKMYNMIKKQSDKKFIITISLKAEKNKLVEEWLKAIKKWEYIESSNIKDKKDLSRVLRN